MRPSILLVEDNDADIRLMKEALAEAQVEADLIIERDGADGLDRLSAAADEHALPDLVVTNINMPRVDGCELTDLIRKDPRLNHLRVLVISTSDRDEDRYRCRRADAFWGKGFTWDEAVDLARQIGSMVAEPAQVDDGGS
ncbi:MAG TPA: response regulator [Planctomycetota bacterium]|nr:response regulator [Planctomycetota bacterium]